MSSLPNEPSSSSSSSGFPIPVYVPPETIHGEYHQDRDGLKEKRPFVSEMDELLGVEFRVLDHGFVRLVDYMGTQDSVVQAARVSYGEGTKSSSSNKGLINYMRKHGHTTPFEMCEVKLHIRAPTFVARQWLRHRTASVNEYSARYSVVRDSFYMPDTQNIAPQSKTNNQGRAEDTPLDAEAAAKVRDIIQTTSQDAYQVYTTLLQGDFTTDETPSDDPCEMPCDRQRQPVARELARMVLPTNFYTEFYWKIDLHNLLHFLRLRADSHAQYEIRVYAQLILEKIVKVWVPHVYEAFMDYEFNAVKLSSKAYQVIKERIETGICEPREKSGMSVREWSELVDLFPSLFY
jgi:thymidylate synthase (FAD)